MNKLNEKYRSMLDKCHHLSSKFSTLLEKAKGTEYEVPIREQMQELTCTIWLLQDVAHTIATDPSLSGIVKDLSQYLPTLEKALARPSTV
jgi:hypothetical protein